MESARGALETPHHRKGSRIRTSISCSELTARLSGFYEIGHERDLSVLAGQSEFMHALCRDERFPFRFRILPAQEQHHNVVPSERRRLVQTTCSYKLILSRS